MQQSQRTTIMMSTGTYATYIKIYQNTHIKLIPAFLLLYVHGGSTV